MIKRVPTEFLARAVRQVTFGDGGNGSQRLAAKAERG